LINNQEFKNKYQINELQIHILSSSNNNKIKNE